MNYVIAVFSSRSESLTYSNLLKKSGVENFVVQTPKEAGRTCGLSVKFNHDYFEYAKKVLSSYRFVSFQGFYIPNNQQNSHFVRR
jgi:hypothetical protein